MIGYAIAVLADDGSVEIEVCDVDTSSRRSSEADSREETLLVGVVHLVGRLVTSMGNIDCQWQERSSYGIVTAP